MQLMKMSRSFLFGLCVSLLFTAFCLRVYAASAGASLQEKLKQRATEYWDYRVSGNWEKAYTFEDPDSLEGKDLTRYIRSYGGGVHWLGVRVADVKIEGNKGAVLTAIRYKWNFVQNNPKDGFETSTWDHWTLVEGKWYHVYDRPSPNKVLGKPEDETSSEQPEKGKETTNGKE